MYKLERKVLEFLFFPVRFFSYPAQNKIRKFSISHWEKLPTIMHRLYWACDSEL